MKHFKLLGLAAMAAMVLTALVGASSASATALYNGTTKLGVGSKKVWSSKVVTRLVTTPKTEVLDECSGSTIEGSITNAGGAGVEVQGSISALTWTGCTVPTSTDAKGGFKIAQIGTSTEGTVRANAEIGVTINTIFFGVCRYGVANGSHLGVIKSSASGTATFTVSAVAEKQAGSEFACPLSAFLETQHVSTTPDNERVETS